MHVAVNTPAGLMELFARTLPSAASFPMERSGRHLRYGFRGLLDVHSHCNLHVHRVAKTTLYTEGSNCFVTCAAASVVTGWNEPVPGWDYLPLKSTGLSRRTAPHPLLFSEIASATGKHRRPQRRVGGLFACAQKQNSIRLKNAMDASQ